MKTINDILQPSNGLLGHWGSWINHKQRILSEIMNTTEHTIEVKSVYTPSQPITVRTFEDGLLSDCNHAGAIEGTVTQYAGHNDEAEIHALLCNKCIAVGDMDGGWNE